ncbi:hypothetical protein BC835DRAFT_1282293 [Cytidiella melzeri]|nr:hypothetical protein BC835DRAFT_1282293 [Cytidiella melzeri]
MKGLTAISNEPYSGFFSSSAAYVPQSACIINATLRDNIIFGAEEDESRLQEIIRACCLERDLKMLPNREYTEIGEKGINLSGSGISCACGVRPHSDAEIVLMDDSLSAIDAYVGKAILENRLLSGSLAGKTRVLFTHSLHVPELVTLSNHGRVPAEVQSRMDVDYRGNGSADRCIYIKPRSIGLACSFSRGLVTLRRSSSMQEQHGCLPTARRRNIQHGNTRHCFTTPVRD